MSFPGQIIDALATGLETIAAVDQAFKRDLKLDDPNCVVGITGADWMPEGMDIGKPTLGAARGPAIAEYQIQIALFVKGLGEEDMYAMRNDITRQIRDLVETDSDLRQSLIGLQETGSLSDLETVRYMTVKSQKPGSVTVEDTGEFAYFSLTELLVKVES